MMRILHRWPGLVLAALLFVTALSGSVLSLFPAIEAFQSPRADAAMTVATLAARVQQAHPGLEQIKRTPSGQITAWWFHGDEPGSAIIDPMTGQSVASADPDPKRRWLTTLHRSLFMGDGGRLAAAAGALAMLVLALSGALLVARRTGGWKRWFARLQGPLAGRLHTEVARIAVFGLVLSSATALWMSAETFEFIPVEFGNLAVPAQVSGRSGLALQEMQALDRMPVAQLRELSFPDPADLEDVFTIKTDRGMGYIDQGTGTLLAWQDLSVDQQASELIKMLHTGQGAAVLGLILGLMALGVPVMAVTGVLIWSGARSQRPRLKGNAPAAQADTVVLVGSEGGSTWGFAATLASALREAGQSVHIAPLSAFAPARYRKAQRFLILAATYGEGDAPASASGFLERLEGMPQAPHAPLAVLGFGDRGFTHFCEFAIAVQRVAQAKGWPSLLALNTIDRQSLQDFTRWGRLLGQAMGIELELIHQPVLPATEMLTLLRRQDFGSEVQVPMAILRFALPQATLLQRITGRGLQRFEAGDLLGILPEGSSVPRLYSLASSSRDGFVEIVVRKHVGGVASTQLTALEPGQKMRAFLRRNPGFHVGRERTPLILVGAGTGVGPLAGFIRNNQSHRPIHLFFGIRNPESDFLYRDEFANWQTQGRLTDLTLAVSRGEPAQYVQDALRQEAAQVAQAIAQGGRVMVCGGRDMARGVSQALADILQPFGLTPEILKTQQRYVEDIY